MFAVVDSTVPTIGPTTSWAKLAFTDRSSAKFHITVQIAHHLPAYQNSMYEATRDDGTEPDDDEPESRASDVKEYYILEQMHRKLMIHHESDTLPDDFFTNPKYSCNASNKSI